MTTTGDKIALQKVNYAKPALIGVAASTFLTALVILGSCNLGHIDAALFGCAAASAVAFGAIFFRDTIWLQGPAAHTYFRRGLQLFFQRKKFAANTVSASKTVATSLGIQRHFFGRDRQCQRGVRQPEYVLYRIDRILRFCDGN